MGETCQCGCEFCRSGLFIKTHTKMDCVFHCKKSHLREHPHGRGTDLVAK